MKPLFIEFLAHRYKLLWLSLIGAVLGAAWALMTPETYRFQTTIEFPVFAASTSSVVDAVQRDKAADAQALPRVLAAYRHAVRERVYVRSRSELGLPRRAADTNILNPPNGTFINFTTLATNSEADSVRTKHAWFTSLLPEEVQRIAKRRRVLLEQGQANAQMAITVEGNRTKLLETDLARADAERAEVSAQLVRRTDIVLENMKRVESEEALIGVQITRQERELDNSRAQRLANRNNDPATVLLVENDIERRTANLDRLKQRQTSGLPAERLDLRRELAELDRLRVDLDRQNRALRLQNQTELTAAERRINELKTTVAVLTEEIATTEPVRVVAAFDRAFEPEPRFLIPRVVFGAVAAALAGLVFLLLNAAIRSLQHL